MIARRFALALGFSIMVFCLARPAVAQEVETETARTLRPGAVKAGGGFEYQVSSDGTEAALPLIVEGGITDRFELVVEPVAFTRIHPKVGANATGIGDLEITLVGLTLRESERWPALALAGEVKLPTAGNSAIGTGKVDAAGYVILSKRFGDLDVHLNGSYTVVGKPDNAMAVSNTFGFAVAAKYYIGKLELFGEVFGNTAASPEGEGAMGGAAELAQGELVGAIGAGYRLGDAVLVHFGIGIDNNAAVLFHPGLIVTYDLL
ncbi:MAG TPA: transporter [Kofleriaceae bacterium]|nr:transporter [Kofleriaceae bacterium]